MTTDNTETLIEQSLNRHAEDAPSDGPLLTRVHARLRRRRLVRGGGAALVAAVAVAAIVVSTVLAGGGGGTATPPAAPPSTTPAGDAPAPGWRWESYRNVELQVPDIWTHGTTGSPPCMVKKRQQPYVGRPGMVPAIGCAEHYPAPAVRSSYLWFDSVHPTPAPEPPGHGWAEEVRTVGDVKVIVFSNDAGLRQRILDSIRPMQNLDSHGCNRTLQDFGRPGKRLDGGTGLESFGPVDAVAVCRYEFAKGSLLGGSALPRPQATALLDAILQAPAGSGPNLPQSCLEKYGEEVIVLYFRNPDKVQAAVLRFSGCDHLGVDDGKTVRQLTKEVVAPVFTGPNTWVGGNSSVGALMPNR